MGSSISSAHSECKTYCSQVTEKKNAVIKSVNEATKLFPLYSEHIKNLHLTPTVDDIDNAIAMHNKSIEILYDVKQLFNDDVMQCDDLLPLLTAAFRDSIN